MTRTPEVTLPDDPDLRLLRDALIEAGGGAVEAIVLYGSRLQQTTPNRYSALDFVVVVSDYARFHDALIAAGHHIRRARTLNWLARRLAPSIVAFSPTEEGLPVAKSGIITRAALSRALEFDSLDHFLKGRLVQQVGVVWSRSDEVRQALLDEFAEARSHVFDWAGPWLTTPMTPESLPRDMLRVSYGGELRPEAGNRVDEVVDAQLDWLKQAYAWVLEDAEAQGRLRLVDGGYDWVTPPTEKERRRCLRYFRRSKRRAVARWGKHVLTFNDWLTYIQRKSERRTGLKIELSAAERRWPLLLLWPKVFKVLRARNRALPEDSRDA